MKYEITFNPDSNLYEVNMITFKRKFTSYIDAYNYVIKEWSRQ